LLSAVISIRRRGEAGRFWVSVRVKGKLLNGAKPTTELMERLDVRFESEADVALANVDVRFGPYSGRIGRELVTSAKCHQQTSLSSMTGSSEELAPQGCNAAGLDQSNHEAKEKQQCGFGDLGDTLKRHRSARQSLSR
jgi:hypothetical protein